MTLKQRLGHWVYGHLPCSRRTFDILRFEFRITRQRLLNSLLPWRRMKIARLQDMHGISLNVGSGPHGHPGWINFDVSPHYAHLYCTHDLRRPLPLADESVHRILAEHVIEHLDFRDDVPRVFSEFHRVLEPGGIARIIVPDTERFLRAYCAGSPEGWSQLGFHNGCLPRDMRTAIELVNHVFHQGGEHCFGWDFAAMAAVLKDAGFARVVRQTFGHCLDPALALDQPNHAPYSLYVDAVK